MKVALLTTLQTFVFLTFISTVKSQFCSYKVTDNKGYLECAEPNENVTNIFVPEGNPIPLITKGFFDSFSKVATIYISRAGMEKIEPGAFDGLDLKSLQLNNNKIKRIENGTFNSLSNTTMLEVFFNHLESLEADVFLGMESLAWMSLSGNHIKNVDKDSFNGLKKLQMLFIASNKIEVVDPDTFHQLTSLELLDLSGNSIKELQFGTFAHQKNVKKLVISDNQLEALPNNLFYNVTALNTLDISTNHINELQKDLFNGIENLKYLKMYSNNLTYLDTKGIFTRIPQLKEVELYDNPWKCNELTKMREDFLKESVIAPAFGIYHVTDKPNVDGIACVE